MTSRFRWTELSLLVMPGVFLALGLAMLTIARPDTMNANEVRIAGLVLIMLLVTHAMLAWRLPASDQLLLPVVAMLCLIGLVMAARLSVIASDLMLRQGLWITIGLVLLMGVVAFVPDVSVLQSYKYTAAILGFLLVGVSFVLGTDPNGSGVRAWIGAGGVYFQPSEILKVLLVIFLAGYLEEKRELLTWGSTMVGRLSLPPIPFLGPLAAMWGVSMLMLVIQKDLGTALLLFGVVLSMLYVASSRPAYVVGGLGSFVVGAYILYRVFAHVRERVDIFVDPWSRAAADGYQVVQGLVALAAGGLLGSGLGFGYPGFIPAVQTDYIISAIGEELGLAGTLALVALYLLLIGRGFRIALDSRRDFSTLLATGLTAVLGIQAVVILAGTIKLAPLTGVTLPFVSYGGSSIVTNFIIIGLLLRISAEDRRQDAT